jgi:hypothetical protein
MVRIHLPPAESRLRTRFSQRRVRGLLFAARQDRLLTDHRERAEILSGYGSMLIHSAERKVRNSSLHRRVRRNVRHDTNLLGVVMATDATRTRVRLPAGSYEYGVPSFRT